MNFSKFYKIKNLNFAELDYQLIRLLPPKESVQGQRVLLWKKINTRAYIVIVTFHSNFLKENIHYIKKSVGRESGCSSLCLSLPLLVSKFNLCCEFSTSKDAYDDYTQTE